MTATLAYHAAIHGHTTSEISQLPVEIQDIIVDYVAGYRLALQALSLTSHQFRALAQPRILKNIILSVNASPLLGSPSLNSPWRFLDLLDVSPHITHYVRSISIMQPPCNTKRPSLAAQVAETMALEEVLSRTANLRSLLFPFPPHGLRPADFLVGWMYVGQDLQNLLIKFHRKEVSYPRHVDLRTVYLVPGTILSSFRNVYKLRIAPLHTVDSNVNVITTENESNFGGTQNPNILHTLELCFSEDWCPWEPTLQFLSSPVSNFDLKRLNTLITSPSLTISQLEYVSSLCTESLQHLVLRTGRNINSLFYYQGARVYRGSHTRTPDLSNLKRLESLTIHGPLVNMPNFAGRYSTPAPWVGSLLTSFAKSAAFTDTFKSLRLELNMEGIKPGGFVCLNWEELVRVLVVNFPRSQMDSIIFKFWIVEGPESSPKITSLANWKLKKMNNDQLKELQTATGVVSLC